MIKPSEQELKELISEITGHEVSEIESETRFKEDLAMDSISVADLLASLEEDFEIIIPQEKAVELQNVAQLNTHIQSL
ncbi:MAG: phosphopantetheine-binding protein [Bdellovibrionota bacterium]|nr:phosphopantetheine-binding protein [Bdellovibrionota bacterium]